MELHLLLDSLRPDPSELTEFRFIKKWIAFEKMVNEQSEADGSMYIFGKPTSASFLLLRRALSDFVSQHSSVLSTPGADEPLKRQLGALERLPIKMLAPKFLDRRLISYDRSDIDQIVDTRNRILHYAEAESTSRNMWELNKIVHRLLIIILCQRLEWDYEEIRRSYASPCTKPLPGYTRLLECETSFRAEGAGHFETEDRACLLKCDGKLEWSRWSIEGQMTSSDPEALVKILDVFQHFKSVDVRLETDDGTLLVDKAKIIHSNGNSFTITGLKISKETRGPAENP